MIRTQIVLGILMMLATIATMAYVGLTEETRMRTETNAQLARRIENGALLYHNNCERCHGEEAEGIPGLCPPLNDIGLLEDRARETGWSGSVHNFLVNTIRGGRLNSTRPEQYIGASNEGMAMPFWSQDYGGPLRNDQIEDIALFLENYPEGNNTGGVADGPTPTPITIAEGDTEAIIEAGVAVYTANACSSCHVLEEANAAGQVGPTHEGMATTAAQRIEDPNYTGEATTAEEYIRESIVNSQAYVVEGYAAGVMPSYTNLPEDQLEALVQMLLLQE